VGALALGTLPACDVGAPDASNIVHGLDTPPVQLGAVSLTTSYSASGGILHDDAVPGEILEGVPITASIRLSFDRFLLPSSVKRQSICVHAATVTVNSIDECTDPFQPFTEPEYNPTLRQVIFRLADGTTLEEDTTYRLSVFPPGEEDDNGFRAFDGAPLFQTYTFDFSTDDGSTATPEPVPTAQRWCDGVEAGTVKSGARLLQSCAFSECHKGATAGASIDPSTIAMGLDLSSADAIAATAIDTTAHGSQQGESASIGDQNPLRFGRAMPIIDPDNPGNSYLMYKILANFLNHPRTNGSIEPQLGLEVDRMRATVITGLPMPQEFASLEVGDTTGVASFATMLEINDWIAHGAPLDCE